MGDKTGYYQPSNEMFDIGLNIYQIGVYAYLCRCSNNSKEAFPSYSKIAEKCGISKRKAIDTVAELESFGLLKKRFRLGEGRNQTNTYKVVFARKGAHGAQTKVHDMQPDGAHDAPNKELRYKEPEEEEPYYIELKDEDHVFIDIYLRYFKRKKRRKHFKVTEANYHHIIDSVQHIESYGITNHEWELKVIEHFKNLPTSNDGNILAFIKASGRHYEVNPYELFFK